MGADVSREGVQRDLLPLIEGTTVTTKHGPVKTDHILFIASGAFHLSKPVRPAARAAGPPADPGRAAAAGPRGSRPHPGRARGQPDQAVHGADGDRGHDPRASPTTPSPRSPKLAHEVNSRVENIGARRLQTVMEKLVEEVSFTASDRGGETVTIDAAYVRRQVADLAANADLSKFIL